LLLRGFTSALARAVRPRLAVPLLTALSLTVALCTGLVLCAAAVLVCAQAAPFARLGQWSAPALRARSGLPVPLGLLASAVAAICLAAALRRAFHSIVTMLRAGRTAKRLHPIAGDMVLVDDEVPIAYSVAGRIVVSTGMMRALPPAERRALIAHEAAHLRHHHHLYLHLARLAAAANPLLRPTAAAVADAVEEWADDDAADEIGDRTVTARALMHAALARAGRPIHRSALAAADHRVVERVERLLAPGRPQRGGPIVVIAIASLLSWSAAVAITLWANDVVQFAERVYVAR
jgi:beta-lactamase regulating signal transducer with metallopeptidase domain